MNRLPIHNRAGKVIAWALVDNADYPRFSKYHWSLSDKRRYICRSTYKSGKEKKYLSHAVLGWPSSRRMVIHFKNDNPLDCRRKNLVLMSKSEQAPLAGKCRRDCTSIYKGVSYDSNRKKWRVEIKLNRKRVFFGRYDTEEEAAHERDKKAIEVWGKNGCFLNFP